MDGKRIEAQAQGARLIRRPRAEPAGRCAIAVMAKASVPGVCKTRLIGPLAGTDAARLNTAFLHDVLDNLAAAARDEPIAAYLAFGPAGSEAFFDAEFDRDVGLIEVALPDFGACLLQTTELLLGLGHTSACVLNSDSPTLPTGELVSAARKLRMPGDRAVLGLSDDGGYYLLGMKAMHARLFEEIAWSTEQVAAQTCQRANEIGLPIERLATWFDVDDEASLTRLALELADESRRGAGAFAAARTATLLQHLLSPTIPG